MGLMLLRWWLTALLCVTIPVLPSTTASLCDVHKCYDRYALCSDTGSTIDCSECKPGFRHASFAGSNESICVRGTPNEHEDAICTTVSVAPYTTARLSLSCHDDDGCHAGWTWNATLRNCVDVDECAPGAVLPHRCGGVARCVNTLGNHACVCPDFEEHYMGSYAGKFRFDGATASCVDDTASPTCTYPQFKYNGTCVLDPCVAGSTVCAEHEMCLTAVDGASHLCVCMGRVIGDVCKRPPCMLDPCPAGDTCVDSPDWSNRTCTPPPDPCAGIDCDDNEECKNGYCVAKPDPCSGVQCSGQFFQCRNGSCVYVDPCAGIDCNDNQVCKNGECVEKPDPCSGVQCSGQFFQCRNGSCVYVNPCLNVVCNNASEVCVNGMCRSLDLCSSTPCGPGTHCEDAECVPDDVCERTTCQSNEHCEAGICLPNDPCQDIQCTGDFVECVNGECTYVDPCLGVVCNDNYGEVCVNGLCRNDLGPCNYIPCGPGTRCAYGICVPDDPCNGQCTELNFQCQDGNCVYVDPCNGQCTQQDFQCQQDGSCIYIDPCTTYVQCGPNQACLSGMCIDNTDPCLNVECYNPGEVCVEGTCRNLENPTRRRHANEISTAHDIAARQPYLKGNGLASSLLQHGKASVNRRHLKRRLRRPGP